jgi:hypothetical protein
MLVFIELDEVPIIPGRVGHGLVGIVEDRLAECQSVPLQARNFAGFAADAGGCIDQLADVKVTLEAGSRDGTGMT